MAFLIPIAFLTVGAVGTLMVLRWVGHVRGARLPSLIRLEEADWMALCRVMAEGRFLDGDRSRRGMGPRGMLVVLADRLEWRPDRYESRHGDTPMSWPANDVQCLARRQRRDLSGLRVTQADLRVPEGTVTFGIFQQVGTEPAFLSLGQRAHRQRRPRHLR
jgi:hypothetical protein